MTEAATQEGLKLGPDQTLTVQEVVSTTDVTNKKDASKPHHRYRLKFAEAPEQVVQAFFFADMNTPQPGSKITGEVKQHPEYGWQFEPKVDRKGGGGYKRSEVQVEHDKVRLALDKIRLTGVIDHRIQRQHSQHMAILFIKECRERGIELGSDGAIALAQSMKQLANAFDVDIREGAQRSIEARAQANGK